MRQPGIQAISENGMEFAKKRIRYCALKIVEPEEKHRADTLSNVSKRRKLLIYAQLKAPTRCPIPVSMLSDTEQVLRAAR
jgi:hypothetical protein